MLVLGEVQTSLLHHSRALTNVEARKLLETSPDRRAHEFQRPVPRIVSAEQRTGVDCRLASASGSKVTCVGTVGSHATVTGGSVLQSTAHTLIRAEPSERRRSWSHYAASPHTVEVLGRRADPVDLANGFLAACVPGPTLDLYAISTRLLNTVQYDAMLDHVTSLRTRTTRIRWVARGAAVDRPIATVRLLDDDIRTVELVMPMADLDLAPGFCRDFALHDWLLTTLGRVVEISAPGTFGDGLGVIAAAVERLLPLWMPGVPSVPGLVDLWESLEQVTGLSRQWAAYCGLLRDRVALYSAGMTGQVGAGVSRPFRTTAPAHAASRASRLGGRAAELTGDVPCMPMATPSPTGFA